MVCSITSVASACAGADSSCCMRVTVYVQLSRQSRFSVQEAPSLSVTVYVFVSDLGSIVTCSPSMLNVSVPSAPSVGVMALASEVTSCSLMMV